VVAANGQRLAESAVAFKAVFKNPNLRRLELAAVGSTVGQWAYSIAVSVYAYEQGGAKAVGIVWLIRSLPSGLASPLGGILADHFRRERVMLASNVARVTLIAIAAGCIWTGTPAVVVYVLSGLVGLAKVPFGPAESAIVPTLATTPTELTAANVVDSTIDSVGFFAGPAIAGVLLGFASVPTVFMFTAGAILWSTFFVARLRPPRLEETSAPAREESAAETVVPFFERAAAGFKTLAVEPRLRLLVGLLVAQTFVAGALQVLSVSIALALLHTGNAGVGYLNVAFGIGALVGVVGAAGMVGLRRLSIPFIVGVALWGPPVAIIGAWPREAVAFVCLGAVGAGNTLVDVAGFTLIQRAVPSDVLARVFGVLQMLWLTAIGLGAVIVPALIGGLGIKTALIVTGCFLPALIVLFGPRLIRIDAAATAPDRDRLALLQGTPIFGPLSAVTLEALAERLLPVHFAAGNEIIREGDEGDRFYLVASGQVDVTAKGARVATLGPGEYVGEIALLHDVPRTATVTARTDVDLLGLERDDFLSALTSHAPSRETAEAVAAARLTDLHGAVGRLPLPSV